MKILKPTIYNKNILTINYQELLNLNIKYLLFDLDNTLLNVNDKIISIEYQNKIKELAKDFKIFIITNAFKNKIKKYLFEGIDDYFALAIKPSKRAYYKLKRKYHFLEDECIIIGDQILTDIIFANRCHIKSILVDPISSKDLKITSFNRRLEKYLIKKFKLLERGKYDK